MGRECSGWALTPSALYGCATFWRLLSGLRIPRLPASPLAREMGRQWAATAPLLFTNPWILPRSGAAGQAAGARPRGGSVMAVCVLGRPGAGAGVYVHGQAEPEL